MPISLHQMTSTSPRDGNLSQWVSNIQERHGGSADDKSTPDPTNSNSSAAELEEEIRKSRAERAKRRSQVVSPMPIDTTNTSTQTAPPTTSGEETLRKLLEERGGATTTTLTEMKTAYNPPSFSSSSPPKQSNTLLDRYGGVMGPTGIAQAGTKDSPASLASFMGGKASGPRLGKLQGDGRTTPPEAVLVDYTHRRALPGMTSGGGTPLASFLEARAGGQPRPTPIRNDSGHHQTLAATTQTDTYSSQHYDRATSPLKAEQVAASKELSPSKVELDKFRNTSSVSTSLAPASVVHSPTSDALHQPTSPVASGVSPAFQATQLANDRMPTASLTRLRSKKMVEQRVREAQERTSTDSSPIVSPVTKSTPTWMNSAQESKDPLAQVEVKDVRSRWPIVEDRQTSPNMEKRMPFPPAKFGNALPGMGQARTGLTRNLYAGNNKDYEERSEVYSPPVRLPGMGSAESPFAARQAAKEIVEEELNTAVQPLEQLAKGRAKPKRIARTLEAREIPALEVNAEERISRQDFSAARGAVDNSPRAASPHKPILHISLDLPEAPSNSIRQDSIPTSADKRMADSTAALEALLEGKSVKTPTAEHSNMTYQIDKIKRSGTLRIARNKDSHTTIDTSAIYHSFAKSVGAGVPKSISIEVLAINSDGSTEILHGEDAKVLYDTETQVITHRFRDSTAGGSNVIITKVFARSGRRSRLLIDPNSIEARKVQEIGKEHQMPIVDARQGRESNELVKLMGGILITREGKRKSIEKDISSMYQVRGSEGAHYIDQVDILTSSLCSAHSVIVLLQGDVFIWHGVGSTSSTRQIALQYARQFKSGSKGQQTTTTIRQYEEGEEDEFFWTCFEESAPYSNAWHHRFAPSLADNELQARLFSLQGQGSSKRLVNQIEFSLVDIRRDGLHILQLPLEIYVIIGPDARSRRKEMYTCIEAASTLAKNVSNQRGSTIMTPPVHVVIFPTIPPRELKSAFRYWHDEHLNGKGWQRAKLGMNVWEKRNALEQLESDEFQLWQVNDDLFLPVGVGLEDVQGIDV